MKKSVYEQHSAAFARVAAFIVLKDGERVASVSLKYPADGAGRLYAYVHVIGSQMVRGSASGGGYDKASAAYCSAAGAAVAGDVKWPAGFWRALALDGGSSWTLALENEGYTVFQII